jgi:rhodanese-related sulfurtransferase
MFGFSGYGFKEIDVSGLRALAQEHPVVLVDVRGDTEVAYGMIEGAQHIPLHLLPLRAEEISKEVHTVFYCRSGARSAQACAFLASKGHSKVYNLQGGVMAWMQSGMGLAKVA